MALTVEQIAGRLPTMRKVCDNMDQIPGGGVAALTNGSHTTWYAFQMELGRFLLVIAMANGVLTSEKVAYLNVMSGKNFTMADYRQYYTGIGTFAGSSMAVLKGFMAADKVIGRANGTAYSEGTALLIQYFKLASLVMVEMDDNRMARALRELLLAEIEGYAEGYLGVKLNL